MIYIFGGSFAEPGHSRGWVKKISDNFQVINFAMSNKSNAHSFLDLINVKDKLKPNDTIIFVINDCWFPYIDNINDLDLSVKQRIMEDFAKHFFNEKLLSEQYKFYLDSFKKISKEKDVKLIALWASPSNYINSDHWPWAKPFYLDLNKHVYITDFPNEIRPSLMFYSKLELQGLSPKEESQVMTCDERPNHIANELIHDAIYDKIKKFINNELSGLTHLPT
jgi:hypothetical protein